tara:strand:+ start:17287 stop:17988 length:702 start_codon:yes stop_codon:yes gene_type:complete
MSLSSLLLLNTPSVQAEGSVGLSVSTSGNAVVNEILEVTGTAGVQLATSGETMVLKYAEGSAGVIVGTSGGLELVGARLMAKCYVSQIPESSGDNIYAPVQHITMRRGDNLILYLRFRDLRDNVYPLTTAGNFASIWFTVKARYSEPDSGAIVQRKLNDGIFVTDGPNGEAQVVLTHAETSLLGAREYDYVWDVQIKRDVYGSESIISTANEGTMTVSPDVTIDVATQVEVSS